MRKGSFFEESQLRLLFPVPNGIQRDSCRAQCHWEVKAGKIRKGQERGSRLQGNKGKPIPFGMILTLETQDSADSGSMGSSGGRKREGARAGYCTKESVPRSIKTTPQSCRRSCYLFRCLSLNVAPPVLAECRCHTHRMGLRAADATWHDHMMANVSLTHTGGPYATPGLIRILFPAYENIFLNNVLSRGDLLTFWGNHFIQGIPVCHYSLLFVFFMSALIHASRMTLDSTQERKNRLLFPITPVQCALGDCRVSRYCHYPTSLNECSTPRDILIRSFCEVL